MRIPRSGRLFWKLVLAFLLTMLSSILLSAGLHWYAGHLPPDGRQGRIPMLPLAAGIPVVVLASLVLAWYLARPLRHLYWALDRIAEGDFSTRVGARMGRRRDEIADLGRRCDRMAERLQRLTQSRTELLHDISHELRSPVARLRAAVGLARQEPEDVPSMLARIDREGERLEALIEALLTLHRLEAGSSGQRTRVDVMELLCDIGENARFEAEALGRGVRLSAGGSFIASVDAELIYRAIENVVRNAVKFTAPDSCVDIGARVDARTGVLLVTVADRGPGVGEEMRTRMFEPFVRGEASEPGTGSGLGLAIARRALSLHGGAIRALPRDGGGLVIELSLPPQQSRPPPDGPAFRSAGPASG